ncbi:MAG: thioredoxin family protein [Trueperaceae bacterium]|nr:thioredoxin family protein [Trueperaceae bacterium]
MKLIVLGPGCANCQRLETNLRKAVDQLGLDATIEKVEDFSAILAYGVQSTPALVRDEKLVMAGRVPSPRQLADLLAAG